MPNELTIAPAEPLAPESLRLAAALWAELSTIYPEQTAPPFPPHDIVGARAVFMIASIGGEAIGCGAIRPLPEEFAAAPEPPDGAADGSAAPGKTRIALASSTASTTLVAEVKRMYVAPSARGGGVAAALLSRLEDWARAHDYRRVQLETGGRQPVAIRLYERFGYARISCYGHHAADPLAICFAKSLG